MFLMAAVLDVYVTWVTIWQRSSGCRVLTEPRVRPGIGDVERRVSTCWFLPPTFPTKSSNFKDMCCLYQTTLHRSRGYLHHREYAWKRGTLRSSQYHVRNVRPRPRPQVVQLGMKVRIPNNWAAVVFGRRTGGGDAIRLSSFQRLQNEATSRGHRLARPDTLGRLAAAALSTACTDDGSVRSARRPRYGRCRPEDRDRAESDAAVVAPTYLGQCRYSGNVHPARNAGSRFFGATGRNGRPGQVAMAERVCTPCIPKVPR